MAPSPRRPRVNFKWVTFHKNWSICKTAERHCFCFCSSSSQTKFIFQFRQAARLNDLFCSGQKRNDIVPRPPKTDSSLLPLSAVWIARPDCLPACTKVLLEDINFLWNPVLSLMNERRFRHKNLSPVRLSESPFGHYLCHHKSILKFFGDILFHSPIKSSRVTLWSRPAGRSSPFLQANNKLLWKNLATRTLL